MYHRKARYIYWLARGLLKKHPPYLFAVIFVLLFLLLFFNAIKNNFLVREHYVEGIVGNYRVDQIPPRITSLVTNSLFVFDQNGKIQPDLAKEIKVEDQKKYTVSLKDDLNWQNHQILKAGQLAIKIEGIEVEVVDDKTIKFSLPESFSPFPSLLTKPIFKKDSLIGTKNYKIEKIEKEKDLVKRIELISIDANLPKITFKFYPSDAQAILALKMGEVDGIGNVGQVNSLNAWQNININKKFDSQKIVTIFLNTKHPLFSSKEFRQALNYQLDRTKFNFELATGPINKDSWVYNEDVKKYKYDIVLAKKLIKNLDLEGKNEITILYLPNYEQVAKQAKADWEKLGLKINLEMISKVTDNFDVLIAGQEIPDEPDQYTLWHSTQKNNRTHFSNPRIDKLLEDGRKTFDENIKKGIYFDFQRVLVDDSPAIFLYYPDKYFIYKKSASNNIAKINENNAN